MKKVIFSKFNNSFKSPYKTNLYLCYKKEIKNVSEVVKAVNDISKENLSESPDSLNNKNYSKESKFLIDDPHLEIRVLTSTFEFLLRFEKYSVMLKPKEFGNNINPIILTDKLNTLEEKYVKIIETLSYDSKKIGVKSINDNITEEIDNNFNFYEELGINAYNNTELSKNPKVFKNYFKNEFLGDDENNSAKVNINKSDNINKDLLNESDFNNEEKESADNLINIPNEEYNNNQNKLNSIANINLDEYNNIHYSSKFWKNHLINPGKYGRINDLDTNFPTIDFVNPHFNYMSVKDVFASKSLEFNDNEFEYIDHKQKASPPELTLNLEVVLKNPGIYLLDDIEKLNNNMLSNMSAKYLKNLPTPEDIHYENFDKYMRPFQDQTLLNMVDNLKLKLCSSTSGISSTMMHYMYKITNFKSPLFYGLSKSYDKEPLKFMMFQRKPTVIKLIKHKIENHSFYSISKDNTFEDKNEFILMQMGKYMEKLLTTDSKEFESRHIKGYVKIHSEDLESDYFKYVKYDKMLLRSQIDCKGTIQNKKTGINEEVVFEIKTRACAPIRYDVHNYKDYTDYEINSLLGTHSSYEREYYDLIRGAFAKYLFQLKIGGMDGAFIAYHNTKKVYGFEYIKLGDMEMRLFGNTWFADKCFKAILKLIQESLLELASYYTDKEQLKIGIYSNDSRNWIDLLVEIPPNENIYSQYDKTKFPNIHSFFKHINYKPKVDRWCLVVNSSLNGMYQSFLPLQYEKNDVFEVKYELNYQGRLTHIEYMTFLHETYNFDQTNLENEFSGLWNSRL